MPRNGLPANVQQMSAAERILLAQDIWDSVRDHPEAWTLSPAQQREVDRRIKRYKKDVAAGRPLGDSWKAVKQRVRRGK